MFKSPFRGFVRVARPVGERRACPPHPLVSPISHQHACFVFLTFSLSKLAVVSAAGLIEFSQVEGQPHCLRRGERFRSPRIFMVLLLYCEHALMTTLALFDKRVSISCGAQHLVARSGKIVCV